MPATSTAVPATSPAAVPPVTVVPTGALAIDEARLRAIIPDGTDAPGDVPDDIFQAALGTFLAGRRLDMRGLARDLRIGRSTLYRKVGDREQLLGEIVWFLTRHAIARALCADPGDGGVVRITATAREFMTWINEQRPFRRFLDQEPEAALRILTSPQGPIQSRMVEATERLLAEEEDAGNLDLGDRRRSLAYVIVRIGESFLYADVIADNEPDLDLAAELIGRLLEPGGPRR